MERVVPGNALSQKKKTFKKHEKFTEKMWYLTTILYFKEGLHHETNEVVSIILDDVQQQNWSAQISENYFKKTCHEIWRDKYLFSFRITS
jgi:hypothetical protein